PALKGRRNTPPQQTRAALSSVFPFLIFRDTILLCLPCASRDRRHAERRDLWGETEDFGLPQRKCSNTGRDVTMGALADSFVAFAQPLIDETDGSMEQLNAAFQMAQVCYNLALLPEASREEMLMKLQADL